ncbi:hypothetical protein [Opitutus sp. ER46]|uniref:hypothetical protein n=1 Tax=Opitutus sp. ER46 TaxID=2161864 RepID=UPI000D314E3A|nr:hypothetical protein [Opitutus sp. ER46]PTX95734.1 hypothetical protein DB354_10005 [Opitutus sp. ER46]
MDVFNGFLDARDDRAQHTDSELLVWLNHGVAPEVRLLKFDAWVSRELAKRVDWTWAGAAKAKRIEQCRVCLEGMVLDLWRRGWMLDGKRLARRIEELLDTVAKYQRTGNVRDFWAYFQAAVNRYVGLNAEEIREEAMRAGAHVGQVLAALGVNRPASGPSLPELVAQRADEVAKAKEVSLRQRMARARARQAACRADADQPRLF